MNNNNNKKFIERYLKTLNVYLDDKQSKNLKWMLELYERVKELDNEIKDLETKHLLLKDKRINIEIGIHELKKRIANKELAQEAILIELEKMITGK